MLWPKKRLAFTIILFAWLLALNHARAADQTDNFKSTSANNSSVSARLLADTSAILPSHPFHLGVELEMQPGWHTYYKDPGEAGMATKIEWLLPPGYTAKALQWAQPSRFDEGGIVTFGYQNQTLISAEIIPPKDLPPGSSQIFRAKVKWLACHEICVPGGTELELRLVVSRTNNKPPLKLNSEEFGKANFDQPVRRTSTQSIAPSNHQINNILNQNPSMADSSPKAIGLMGYLGLALIGGLILNFMPCVLPVVAIKVLSLLEQSHDEKAKVRWLGIAFAAGILSSFLTLALLVIALQRAGQNVGWGFQFQYPPFVIGMATIVLVFALSLFGQLNLAINVGQRAIGQLSEKEGLIGTFFKGVLATILSTPCTAPFLGTALGFAFVQPGWIILAIFFAVGLGMALPYLLLTINPGWMKFLPKPGVWMETLKEFFGFVLLATVAWLISVLGVQVGIEAMLHTIYFLLSVALAVWIINRFSDLTSSLRRTIIVRCIALALAAAALYLFILSEPGLLSPRHATTPDQAHSQTWDWQPFSVALLNESLHSNKTILLDFSAKWCLTCQVNEAIVLHNQTVIDKLRQLNVMLIKADWTNQDPVITQLLKKFGRSGVPLYVIFPAKRPDQPIVLPELITVDLVLHKLDEAGPSLGNKPN